MTESIEMPFGPKEPCIIQGSDPPCELAILRGERDGPL